MKDIRLLGDIVKLKLAEFQLPINIYIGIENVMLLVFSAKLNYILPFSAYVDNLQSLVVVAISVVYGYQASLRGIAIYLALGLIGVPVFESYEAGFLFIMESGKLPILCAYFLASVVAATLSTYHWDRKFSSALILFVFCLSAIHLLGYAILSLNGRFLISQDFIIFSAYSIGIEALIGALFTHVCWHLSYTVFPELKS